MSLRRNSKRSRIVLKTTGRILAVFALAVAAGCASVRSVAVPRVADEGNRIRTKHRYCYVGSPQDFKGWSEGRDPSPATKLLQDAFRAAQSDVFTDDGIPFSLDESGTHDEWGKSELANLMQFVCVMGTCGIAPFIKGSESNEKVVVQVANDTDVCSSFDLFVRDDDVGGLTPIPYLFFDGLPDLKGFEANKVFAKRYKGVGAPHQSVSVLFDAVAYGVAVRLKEMEERGLITDDVLARAGKIGNVRAANLRFKTGRIASWDKGHEKSPRSYRVVKCEREKTCDFAYRFVLEMQGADAGTLATFRRAQNEFRSALCEEYAEATPTADYDSLVVDFPEFKMNRTQIEGRGVVLTIAPVSLNYDSITRHGVLSVRFVANQYEEARSWAKRNIETLARDKNIALVTGQLPPEARYYSLGEKLKDGNVLEIEFKTE